MNPQDGAAIGDMNIVTVTINRNDDVNGVFSFDSVLVSIIHITIRCKTEPHTKKCGCNSYPPYLSIPTISHYSNTLIWP